MTVQEADQGVAAIWAMYERQKENLGMVRCLGVVGSTGQDCTKKRKPHSYFCAVHGKKADQQLRGYLLKIMRVELDRLWQKYYDAGVNRSGDAEDEEVAQHLANTIDTLQDYIDSLRG
jgi:hypothetical protein